MPDLAADSMSSLTASPTGNLTALDLLQDLRGGLSSSADHQESRASLRAFYEKIFSWVPPSYQEPLFPVLENLGSQPANVLTLAPPGHAKTTLLCAYAAWLLGRDPNLRIIVATHTATYSALLLSFIEEIIASKPYREIFGNLIPSTGTSRWTAYEKFLLRSNWRSPHPSLLAIGAGSSTIGYRADVILADDLVTQQNSMTAVQRAHLASWYFGSLTKRLEPEGHIVVIGARFYSRDLYGALLSFYEHYVFKASPDRPLWPERFTAEALKRAKAENYVAFCAQYGQLPIDLETGFLKESDLHYFIDTPPGLFVYQGVDVAAKAKSTAKKPVEPNYFAHATVGLDESGTIYLLDLVYAHLSESQQREVIEEQGAKWHPLMINFETDAAQELFYQSLVSTTNLPLNAVTSQGIPKSLRLASVATHFRNQKVLIRGMISPGGAIIPAPAMNPFVEEWRGYPHGGDDALDAVERAVRAALGLDTKPASATTEGEETPESRPASQIARTLFRHALEPALFH